MQTHEAFVSKVAEIAIARLTDEADIKAAKSIKLVYGAGQSGLRGVTYFHRWKANGETQEAAPFVEVCAFGQESWVQVAGTTIHELGHVLAGWEAGHGKGWKEACERLGLRRIKAAGTAYCLAMFAPDIRNAIAMLEKPNEGEPVASLGSLLPYIGRGKSRAPKPCTTAIGVRGGKSRGVGSGSRLRLWECEGIDHKPWKVRVASDSFDATCDCCNTKFQLIR